MKKIKIIMIDAFKPDYLKYTPYISDLTNKYQWGVLDIPFGHECTVETFFKGESDRIALFCKNENSSLKWIKYFQWLEYFGDFGRLIIECMINSKRLLRKEELFRSGRVPLNRLYKFDFSVGKPPYYNLPVEFKYFGELDKIGHKYGTKSQEIIKAIQEIDKKISGMDFDVIFSDHGMIDITETISVPETENCFIDSDMARYWGSKEELMELKKKLPKKYGKIINYNNEKYANLIFLANEGLLISPNYWQGKNLVKGMHGYNPEHREMKAFYMLNKEGSKKNLHIKELHDLFKKMLLERGGN